MLTAEALRAASTSFKERTAVSADGWHMKHFSLLSDEALAALALLLAAMEALGVLPRQLRYIVVVLLAKPAGG